MPEPTAVFVSPEMKQESLARQHSDLRLAPADVPEDLAMNDPLNHFDLRIKEVKSEYPE